MGKKDLSRRGFFVAAGAAAAGGATLGSAARAQDKKEGAKDGPKLRTLGRTGLEVTEMSFGTAGSGIEPDVLRHGLDLGINLIHTSLSYANGNSIKNVAEAINGRRDDLYLAIKCTWKPEDDASLDKALKALHTDCIDLAMFPLGSVERVKSPEVRKAFERWKKAGKVRFMGLTSHKGVVEVMEAGIETDWYDIIMPTYNLSMKKKMEPVFKLCAEKNLAFMPMKTAKGLSGMTFEEAIPVYLKDPSTATICKGMRTFDEVDDAVAATHRKPTGALLRKAELLAAVKIPGNCEMCGQCTDNCPNGLAVNDMVRSVEYYMDVTKHMDEGQEVYAEIPASRNASACGACGTCERVCPNGVAIRAQIQRAHKTYS